MNGSLAAALMPAQMPEGHPAPYLFSHAQAGGYPVTPLKRPVFPGSCSQQPPSKSFYRLLTIL
jgi:hypothetical protein